MNGASDFTSATEARATFLELSEPELDARISSQRETLRKAQQAAAADPSATEVEEKLLALLHDVYKEKNGKDWVPPEARSMGVTGKDSLSVKPPNKPNSKKSTSGKSGTGVSNTGAKLKMPSTQAGKLTTAFNRLLELKDKRDAEDVVVDALEKAERELQLLKSQVDLVLPVDVPQQQYKDAWLAKNVHDKEKLIKQVRKAVDQERRERHENRSTTSSVRLAAIEAEAEEAALLLRQRQMARNQEQRRLQWQEEERRRQKEQEEQDQLEIELERIRTRKDALRRSERGSSRASSVRSLESARARPIQEWLSSVHPEPEREPESARIETEAALQAGLLQHVLLAQAKLPMFKGDQLDFVWFMKAFQTQVEAVTADPNRKLHLLLQQLEGEPHTLVKACLLAPDPQDGFSRAKAILNERYGNSISQGLAFKKKLLEWSSIRSAKELTGFSVQLQLCQEMKANGKGLGELDSAATLFELANKLSYKLRSSWQNRVIAIEEKENREARFEDFAAFVRRHEKAQTHPVFGKLDTGPRETARKDKSFATGAVHEPPGDAPTTPPENDGEPESVLVTTTSREKRGDHRNNEGTTEVVDAFKAPCLFCSGDHPTSQCVTNTLTREEKRARLRGLCFSCLKPGHSARKCRFRLKCGHCQGLHPTVLHEDHAVNAKQPEAVDSSSQVKEPAGERNLATATCPNYAIATVPVRLWVGSRETSVIVRALLDPASTATFISSAGVQLLRVSPESTVLSLSTMAGQDTPTNVGLLRNLRIADVEGNAEFTVNATYVVEALPVQEPPMSTDLLTKWPHLADIPWDLDNADAPLVMLIGLNVHEAIAIKQSIPSPTGKGPSAIRSALGWSLQGPLGPDSKTPRHASVNWTRAREEESHALNKLYYTDFEDAFDFSTKGLSREDRDWLDRAEKSARRLESGKYEVELPFRNEGDLQLSNNYSQAYQRLHSLKRKFSLNPSFQKDYKEFLQKMIDHDHVERVTEECTGQPINYVPHHGVYHPQKPGKIRVVFNCASRYKGVSLNDCLISGPDLTNSIIAVLLRFRQYPVAFMADIEAMFYQVQVPERQRDTLRFLWWPGGAMDQDVVTYRMKVHLFGATSSPSVANFALRRAAEQAEQKGLVSKGTKEAVLKNFYVDDCLVSRRSEQEAAETARQLVQACRYGGFRLTKFVSTSVQVLQSFEQTELAKGLLSVDLSDNKADPLGALQERALGVAWNVAKDEFVFRVAQSWDDEAITKRTVLSQLSKVYDPLGLAAPVIIMARMFFRELNFVANRVDWDAQLTEDRRNRWTQWRTSLKDLEHTTVPRCYTTDMIEDTYELHTFCDASSGAYAAVSFLRSEQMGREGAHKVAFALGKARVAPPKTVTIPRMELTAAKLAAELANNVTAALEVKISRRVFWSDSTTVLKYLKNRTKRFHVFVSNRINSILHLSEPEEWRYVPTSLNPADEGTRGVEAAQLAQSAWIQGPKFLRDYEEHWPKLDMQNEALDADDPEVRRESTLMTKGAESQSDSQSSPIHLLTTHYSTAFKVRRAVALWTRFYAWLRNRTECQRGMISLTELKEAETMILTTLQIESWAQERTAIQRGQRIKKQSPLYRLHPTLKEGVIHAVGRADWSVPVVPKGPYARLLVREAHERQLHLGRQSTAADVLRRYHVIGLGKLVREVLRVCPKCQVARAPLGQTIMAPLPPFRVNASNAFETTGVDYFGPFTIRSSPNEEQSCKAYGVIFSCATTRAIHLEVAVDLSSSGFINSLRRFTARRGAVKRLLSDNGTNFKGAAKELRDELQKQRRNKTRLEESSRCLDIEWQFNPPAASHFGGFWERLIRTIRQMLDTHTRDLTSLNLDAFHTLLCECEAILNDRPLTTVGLTNAEADLEALTPNHLLLNRASGSSGTPATYARANGALRNRWRCVQHAATQFWRRWTKEYLALLQVRTKWFIKKRDLKVDDVVLVADPVKPRAYWKLGRVTATYPSRDGVIRVADVKTSAGLTQRPITKLCLLETASNGNQD